jgi:hypothetical protein
MGWFFNKDESPLKELEPYGRCDFEISGESYKTGNLKKLFKKYGVQPGDYHLVEATLQADPANPYDKNAVEVFVDSLSVGYIPKNKAKKISILLLGETKKGNATVKALIKRGREDIGFSTVRLDLNWPPALSDQNKSGDKE